MSMTAGFVSVDASGNATGTGAALSLMNSYLAAHASDFHGATPAQKSAGLQGVATLCNTIALLIDYIKANATLDTTALKAHVAIGGLQSLPVTLIAGTPTAAPSAAIDVPITGSATIA